MTTAGHVMKEPAEKPSQNASEDQQNRDPVPIGALIRAFRGQPEKFIADTFPEPPEAA